MPWLPGVKITRLKKHGKHMPLPTLQRAFEILVLGFITGIPRCGEPQDPYTALLVAVDAFTGFSFALPATVGNTTKETFQDLLLNIFFIFNPKNNRIRWRPSICSR
jgi:hypothetical protein